MRRVGADGTAGQWRAARARDDVSPRPKLSRDGAGVAWIDRSRTSLKLYPGRYEPPAGAIGALRASEPALDPGERPAQPEPQYIRQPARTIPTPSNPG